MRIPRDMDGEQLVKRRSRFGYMKTRQAGSHMRLTTRQDGEHHVTIPAHDPLRVGMLNSVISDVASHLSLPKEEVLRAIVE